MAEFAAVDETAILTFNSHGGDSQLNHRNGERIFVIDELDPSEYDREEVGPMYRVMFEDGFEVDAFEDEIEGWLA